MASILLIRHAQASFGTDDYDRLSALGIEQAGVAGKFLGATGGRIARIMTGPLRRQRDTAAAIAAKVLQARGEAPRVEVDARLDELRIDDHIAQMAATLPDPGGELAGHLAQAKTSSRSYQKVIQHVFTHWQRLSHDAEPETWPAFATRAREVMRAIAARSGRGDTIVAVSSGALIATITQYVLGLPDSSTYGLFEALQNCSITHFLHSGARMSLSSFNDTTYLAAAGSSDGTTSLVTYR